MPAPPRAASRRPAPRRSRRWIAALALAGLLTGAFLARRALLAPWLVGTLERLAREELGLALTVDEVGGDWLTTVELTGVELAGLEPTGTGPAPWMRLTGGRAVARVDWRAILRRAFEDALASIEVEVDGLELDLTASAGSDEPFAGWSRLPGSLPEVRASVRTSSWRVAENLELRIEGLRLANDGARALVLDCDRLDPGDALPHWTPGPVSAHLADTDEALVMRARLQPSLTLEELRLEHEGPGLAAHLVLPSGSVRWRSAWPPALATGELTAEVQDLADLAALVPAEAPIETRGTLEIEGRARDSATAASWSLRIAGRGLGVLGRSVERLELEGVLDAEAIEVATLDLHLGANRLRAVEASVPLEIGGALPWYEQVRAARGRFELDCRDFIDLLGPHAPAPADAERTGAVPAHRLALGGRFEGSQVELFSGRLETVGGAANLRGGSLRLEPDPEHGGAPRVSDLRAELDWSFADLAPLGEALGDPSWRGRAEGELLGSFDGERARVRVRGDLEALELPGFALRSGKLELEGEGALELEQALPTLPAHLSLRAEGFSSTAFRAESLEVDADLTDGTLHVRRAHVASPEGSLALAGTVRRAPPDADPGPGAEPTPESPLTYVARVDELVAERAEERLELVEPFELRVAGETIRLAPFDLAGDLGHARGRADFEPERLLVELELRGFDPMPWFGHVLPPGLELAALDGDLVARRAGEELALELDLPELALALGPGRDTVRAALDADLRAERLRLDLVLRDGGERLTLRGEAPFDPLGERLLPDGPLELELAGEGLRPSRWARRLRGEGWSRLDALEENGQLQLAASLGGRWSAVTGTATVWSAGLSAARLLGSESDAPDRPQALDALDPAAFDLVLALGPESIDAELGLTAGADVRGQARGRLGLVADVPAWLAGELPWSAAALDAQGSVDVPDIAFLRPLLTDVRRLTGGARLELRLDGPLGAPRFAAAAHVTQLELRSATALPAMRNLGGSLRLDEAGRGAVDLAGELGGAPFELRGSLLRAATGPDALAGLADAELDLELRGRDLLLARTADLRVRADADLVLTGTPRHPRAGGTIEITEGYFGRHLALLAGLVGDRAPQEPPLALRFARSGPLADVELGVRVTARTPFVVRTNVVQGEMRPELEMSGRGEAPVFRGRIYVDDTTLRLPSGNLRVESGLVEFQESDPLVPRLALTGTMRARGYDLVAQVSGPYDDPEVLLSSSPPLPQEDLLYLFLTGQLSETGSRLSATSTAAVYFTQDLLTRWLMGDDESTILERLDLEIGSDVTRSGSLTTRAAFHLTGALRGPGRSTYLAGEQDLYDQVNFGWGLRFRFR